jgi:hypothetical protein
MSQCRNTTKGNALYLFKWFQSNLWAKHFAHDFY